MRDKKRVLIFELGLFFLAACLPLSYGVPNKEQGAAFCLDNACYTVHLGKVKFTSANNSCINKGGDLVTIRSKEEATPVYDLLSKLTESTQLKDPLKLWIGLYLKKNNCVRSSDLLKGFSWTTGSADTSKSKFSNWMREPKTTCTREVCVSMLLHVNSPDNLKWVDGPCSAELNGYICKFDFKGMCPPLVLAGPGLVEYETPFSFKVSSLNLLPFGSSAYVSCGDQGEGQGLMLLCKNLKESSSNVYQWGDTRPDRALGPLCASEELGCKYNNGGCEHECVETTPRGSISCRCKDGYVLASDMLSCVVPDHCESKPCDHLCTNHQHSFECTCLNGFALAENKLNCFDINECLETPCNQTCVNTVGSFQCHCHKGFIQQGTECIDIDECINSSCSQGCLNTHGSYLCSCNNGYTLSSDKMSCEDKDECENSPCAHHCANIPGGYLCSCPEGFLLSSDRISCVPERPEPNVTPNFHKDEDLSWKEMGSTSISHKNMSHKPTPSSVTLESFVEKENKGQQMTTPVSYDDGFSTSNSPVDQVISDPPEGYSMVLLIGILCACSVVLILLVVAGGVLCYRRRNTKKEEAEEPQPTTENYIWGQKSENKSVNNDYR